MDILLGFDLAIELDRLTLFHLVRSHPLLAPFRTPFELTVEGTEANGGGSAHFVFVDSDLFLGTGNVVELRLSFAHSSVIGNTFVRRDLEGGDLTSQQGTISIIVPISIETGPLPTARDLMLDLRRANTVVHFERPADDIPRAHIITGVQTVIEFAIRTALQAQIRALAGASMPGADNPRIPLALRVDPTSPATLSPLVAHELQLKVIGARDPALQSLVLFIMLGGTGHGRLEERTQAQLPAGANLAFTLSRSAFHQFVFIPAVLEALLVARAEMLPPTCGRSESVPYPSLPDWSITHIEDSLRRNAVGLFIHARHVTGEEPFQSAIHGDIHGHLSMTVDRSGSIVPNWTTDSVEFWTSWGTGWWFISIFGPIVTMAIVNIIVFTAGRSSGDSFTPSFSAIAAPLSLPGARLRAIDVDSDHFSMAGVMSPRPGRGAGFLTTMTSAGRITDRAVVASDTYQSQGCPEGDYPYTTFHQIHQMAFSVQPQFGSHPIRYAWRVASNDSALPGEGGNLHLAVTRYIPDPPPGSPVGTAEIDMPYEVSADGTHLTLLAQPDHGNFRVNVVCMATDADGRTSTTYGQALFMTREVVLGGSWQEDFAACMRRHARALYQPPGIDLEFPHGTPQFEAWPPEPGKIVPTEVLAEFLLQRVLAHKEKDIATLHAIMTFGPSLETNLQFPPAISPEVAMQIMRVFSKMLSNVKKGEKGSG